MKNCILCDQGKFIPTDAGSPSKGEMWIDKENKSLTIEASRGVTYSYPISFCPLCGEKFDLPDSSH